MKKVSYNENNPFTDFDSKLISIDSIIRYEKKMVAFKKVINELNLLKKARTDIYEELKIKQPDSVQIIDKNKRI